MIGQSRYARIRPACACYSPRRFTLADVAVWIRCRAALRRTAQVTIGLSLGWWIGYLLA